MARTPYNDPQAEKIYQHANGNPKYAEAEILQFPISQDVVDYRRIRTESIINNVSKRYGISSGTLRSKLPTAKIINSPYANK